MVHLSFTGTGFDTFNKIAATYSVPVGTPFPLVSMLSDRGHDPLRGRYVLLRIDD